VADMVRKVWVEAAARKAGANARDGEYAERYAKDNMRCEVRLAEWCYPVGDP
jgi:hypothetical protein